MRHLFALLLLSLGLAACDDSTTAPTDTIPGPPNAPRLTLTVLTGTKAAPVDSPTVKVEWAYTDSVSLMAVIAPSNGVSATYLMNTKDARPGKGEITLRAGCNNIDSSKIYFMANDLHLRSEVRYDSLIVHCK